MADASTLVPALEILEQDRAELDQAQGRFAPGDDGVDAGAIGVVRADATVAVAVERRGVAARAAVTLTGDEIDEGRFLGLLHGLPLSVGDKGTRFRNAGASLGSAAGERLDFGGFWHSIGGQPRQAKRENGHPRRWAA